MEAPDHDRVVDLETVVLVSRPLKSVFSGLSLDRGLGIIGLDLEPSGLSFEAAGFVFLS